MVQLIKYKWVSVHANSYTHEHCTCYVEFYMYVLLYTHMYTTLGGVRWSTP